MATGQDRSDQGTAQPAKRSRGRRRKRAEDELRQVQEELRLVVADRDAAADTAERLARHLDIVRAENAELRERLARVCREPIETDGLTERVLHLVELAHMEADEIIADAKIVAKHTRDSAGRAAKRLRDRYERLIGDVEEAAAQLEEEHRRRIQALDDRRMEMEHEHSELMREAGSEVDRVIRDTATAARAEADRVVQDAAARAEALVDRAAERDRTARAEAERVIEEATGKAEEMVNSAAARVDALNDLRARLQADLNFARETLADAITRTEALPGEGEVLDVPAPREEVPAPAVPHPGG